MPAAVAIPAAIATAAAVGGASVYQGQMQKRSQRRALRSQEAAQDQALAAAASEQRRTEMEQRKLNRRQPDLGTILAGQRARGRRGAASTLLTGATGVGRGSMTLGTTSLLGGGS